MSEPALGDYPWQPLTRTRYFDGRLLSAADLERDQQYQRQARYLHNRALGYGVVEGLEISAKGDGISVSPGFALDALGRELVLTKAVRLTVDEDAFVASPRLLVTALWSEIATDPLPSDEPDLVTHGTWVESPTIAVEATASPTPPAILLGRLRRTRKGRLSVDLLGREDFRLRSTPSRSV